MKLFLITIALLVAILALIELVLRLRYGLGDPLLYIGDPEIGYLIAPNQSVIRNGNPIRINQFSMRSDAIAPMKAVGETRMLFIGDSVVNGGWWTPQEEIISEQVKRMLQREGAAMSVLNASANSWSPRSELAYLQRFGTFDANAVVLVINTDDLFATAPTSLVVGTHPNYPDRKPVAAIVEFVNRMVLSQQSIRPELQAIYDEKGDRVGKVLEAIGKIQQIAQANQAGFLLIMTPLLREVETQPRDYEIVARDRLTEFTRSQKIYYTDMLPIFKAHNTPKSLYHDHIHLNQQGNQQVSDQVLEWLG
jgi:GDSL-like Lipase/Acylhydrolase family